MKKKLPIKVWVHAFTILSASFIGFGSILYQSGSGGGYTNAPSESNCTSCHSGSLNPTPGNLNNLTLTGTFTGGGYIPDSVYTLTVSYSQTGINKFGFQVTSLTTADNTYVGTYTAGTGSSKVTKSVGGTIRQYVQQNSSGTSGSGSRSWSFTWQAPSSNVDTISFYVTVNAANGNGQDSGDEIYAKVVKIPPSSLLPRAIRTTSKPVVCAGDTVTYYASGTNSPTSYRWKFSFGFPSTSNNQSVVKAYSFPGIFRDTLWVTNAKGESVPEINTLQVISGTTATITSVSPNDTACVGDKITLAANTAVGLRYVWNTGNPADTLSTVDISQSGTYNVTVINSGGCSKTSSDIHLTFVPVPNPSVSSNVQNDTLCQGDTLKVTATGGFTSYSFVDKGVVVQNGPSNLYKTTSTGDHAVKVIANNGYCSATSADSVVKHIKARLAAPVINCTANTDTVFFTWNASGFDVYEVSENGGTTWMPPNQNPGEHRIGGVGFSTKAELWVRKIGSGQCSEGLVGTTFCITDPCSVFNFDVLVSDSTFCFGDSTKISVENLSPGNYTFSYNGGTEILDSVFYYKPPSTNGVYTVAINDLNSPSCPPLQVIKTLYIDTIQQVNVNYSSLEFCYGDELSIQASAQNPTEYYLYLNSSVVDTSLTGVFKQNQGPGLFSYKVGVKGDECLSISSSENVLIHSPSTAKIGFTGSNREYVFYDSTQNGVSRIWNIGPGLLTDTNKVVPYNFTSNGSYLVQLITTDNHSCVDSTNIFAKAVNTGMSDYVKAHTIIYPNPSSSRVTVKSDSEIKSIAIYSVLGAYHRTVNVNDLNQDIDLSDLKPGVYLLKVRMRNGEEGVFKVFKE